MKKIQTLECPKLLCYKNRFHVPQEERPLCFSFIFQKRKKYKHTKMKGMNLSEIQQLIAMQQMGAGGSGSNLTIKAGKFQKISTDKENQYIYKPINRKGELQFIQGDAIEVRWKERDPKVTKHEDSFFILPGITTYYKVEGVEGGRVYCFDFQDRQEFFWMQDNKPENDEKKAKEIRELIKPKQNADLEAQQELFKTFSQTKFEFIHFFSLQFSKKNPH